MTTPSPLFGATTVAESATTGTALAVQDSTGVLARPAKKLDAKQTAAVAQLKQNFAIDKVDNQQVVLFGSDRQKAAGQALNTILVEVTKGSSPVLFEMFKQLQKGVEAADLPALEEQIRKSQNTKWWFSILDSLKLSSVAKLIEKANDRIGSMLTSRSTSILDLTTAMEKNISEEVSKLITNGRQLDKLANEFRSSISDFEIYVSAGHQILTDARARAAAQTTEATASNDPLKIEAAKRFVQKVDLFEARVVVLETILAKAPVELETIRLTQGAALTVLGETANSALEEFNDIKSILIKLATAHQITTIQQINDQRRLLRETLNSHAVKTLGDAATQAAKSIGQNRIDDANKLLAVATSINAIAKKVDDEYAANQGRFSEARNKIGEVKKLMGQDVIDI